MMLSLNVLALLALIIGLTPAVPDECPLATLTCYQSSSNKAEYECGILAHYPSKRNAPQYKWAVSEGRIIGDPKSPNVTVEVSEAKSETVTVTAKVHWRRIPRVCDAYMTEKLKLR
jgi:hypothetical protein